MTEGSVTKTMLLFAAPMIMGNLLQQFYNIADSLIVGRFVGAGALAAVGSAYTLMTFLTSVLIGLCMGSGSLFSFYFGKKDKNGLHKSISSSFLLIAMITLLVNVAVYAGTDGILKLLQVPQSVYGMMKKYVLIIFGGIFFVFLYNYFAYLHREGSFYWGIGLLFLLYGYFRGSGKPEMSIILTVISLGSRVVLAYALSPIPGIGVYGIWWAIPIGWILADLTGVIFYFKYRNLRAA